MMGHPNFTNTATRWEAHTYMRIQEYIRQADFHMTEGNNIVCNFAPVFFNAIA